MGHLIELAEPESYGDQWKKWTYESLPVNPEHWQYEIKEDTKEQYDVLYGLLHDSRVDEVVCATDAGREGEFIFRLVYEQAGCSKPMKRLWISSMEESAIREGFENLKPGSDYEHLYHSALCRQEADWLVGINGTRLFTVLYGGKVLKVGRVQTPTLAMLVEREAKIMNFKKEQYFMAHILCGGVDVVTERIDSKTEAENVAGACLNGQALVTSVVKEEKTVTPPKLYDITTLQRDANRLFGFTAKQTLEYTQSLYEKSCVPIRERTASICLTIWSRLPETERKILSLVANRLLCATGEKHLYETVKAELACGGYTFATSGKSVLKNGWKDFKDAFKRSFKTTEDKEQEDKKLPELSEGQTFDGVQTKISEHYTTPPKHFTDVIFCERKEWIGIEERSSA